MTTYPRPQRPGEFRKDRHGNMLDPTVPKDLRIRFERLLAAYTDAPSDATRAAFTEFCGIDPDEYMVTHYVPTEDTTWLDVATGVGR